MTESEELTIQYQNMGAGAPGDRVLEKAMKTDMSLVASWSAVGGGNCFFASVQMLANLIETKQADGFTLVTGIFSFPDLSYNIIHSWLEHGPVVLNVSNLKDQPLYVRPRKDYYQINHLSKRIQRIEPKRLRRWLRESGGDVRYVTKNILKPTMAHSTREVGNLT